MEEAIKWIEAVLEPFRYRHSLRVMEAAGALARRHGLDGERTRLAALLHDCARSRENAELLDLAGDYGLTLRDIDRESPVLLHGRVGAELARFELGIDDPEILDAIRFHTAGHPHMGPADKVVFLADLIEPERPFPHRAALEAAAFDDLDRALLMGVEGNLRHCRRRGLAIDPDTLALRAALLKDPSRRGAAAAPRDGDSSS